ncbi:MAG TPA: hypothetical protein VFS95_04480, partial [Telluria sp.]|nr:hypothetical protein [Telluria sp.]
SKELSTILVRPAGLGQAHRSDEFFLVDPQSTALTRISEALVPQTQLTADGGGRYSFKQQNGWVVDVSHISRPNERWTARSIGDDIQVDMPGGAFRVIEDEAKIRVRVIGPVGHYVVTSARRNLEASGWFWFPWSRTWFVGDDSDRLRCMPFTELLEDLSDVRRVRELASQWAKGLRVDSTAFNLPPDRQWSV